ncbi:MAG TPA: GH25 family lysozyme, partial [Candidatus Limnocylindrales bacterium]
MPRLAASVVAVLVLASIAPVAVAAAPAPVSRDAAPATAAAATTLEGIDVSHWQGTINWPKVAAAGKKFAIIKASEDIDFVDDHYATNRSQAQAAGIWTGAYHFARPDASANDAVEEADHFADTMSLGVKDLIPALDLEDSGGLSVAALQSWVSSFMARVTTRIGIRPMIYVSPAFWKKYMGDTRAFADAGYRTLWIAHWGVSAPSVPASNWGGRGWTFWQYSNCGTVSGISGCVDLDRFNGADLLTQAYSAFRLTATSGSQVKQGRTAAAATVGIVRTNFTSSVELNVSGLPSGATAAFDESPTTSTAATMHVTTDAAAVKPGSYPLVVTGEGQGLKRSVRVTLVVADGIAPTVVGPSF